MQKPIEMVGDVPVVHVIGQFDRTSALDSEIDAVLAHDPSYVVMDFGHASYINSYGIAILVKVMKRCRGLGGDLLLVNVPESIHRIFEVICLDRVFTIHPDITTALEATS